MPLPEWSLFLGLLLITMVLSNTLLERLPLSNAMVYLALGWLLGPAALGVLRLNPFLYTPLLERFSEIAVLISLFSVGMQLGVPVRDPLWWLPLRLALVSMVTMVAMVAAIGVWVLGMSLGAAVLVGAILAPTDPVLASGVQSQSGANPDRLGFSLAGEGGLNDGTSYPMVMLGLGLLGLHPLGERMLHWWAVEFLWSTIAGLAIGAALGAGTGRLVVYLRSHHKEATGLNEFLGIGLIGMAYGAAQLSSASGFLAVFAAGLALQRVRENRKATPHKEMIASPMARTTGAMHDASDMQDSVHGFNEQLERLAELALVLMVGAMLAYAKPMGHIWWFIPLVLLILRPVSTLPAVWGRYANWRLRTMIGWFGIRGIGSIFYMLLALRHGVDPATAATVVSLTLWTVAASIIVHGITVLPLMKRYMGTQR
jgi:NhaP-type Na+/H+ or K+/H+ antiporter